jgi:hypothetical protein
MHFIQFNLDDNGAKLVVRYVLPGTTPSGNYPCTSIGFMIPFFRFEPEPLTTRNDMFFV